jgi:hypothetical protein
LSVHRKRKLYRFVEYYREGGKSDALIKGLLSSRRIRHYDAYGGTKPPPIDHQGIDDAFLEEASVTWYFYGGRWLKLSGAD